MVLISEKFKKKAPLFVLILFIVIILTVTIVCSETFSWRKRPISDYSNLCTSFKENTVEATQRQSCLETNCKNCQESADKIYIKCMNEAWNRCNASGGLAFRVERCIIREDNKCWTDRQNTNCTTKAQEQCSFLNTTTIG
ncbi:hypothetical protein CDIK_0354 [Cucumispora dikerogammari]|nr:hypothetical protein CDIK_0354 [Cucumispora dikerogammari]